jgi:hypothetical protein
VGHLLSLVVAGLAFVVAMALLVRWAARAVK